MNKIRIAARFFKFLLIPIFYNYSLIGAPVWLLVGGMLLVCVYTDTGTPPSTCMGGGTAAVRPGTTQQTRRAAFASSTICIVASPRPLPRCRFKNSIVASTISFLTSRTCRHRIHRLRFYFKILPRCAHSFQSRANTDRLCATRSCSPSLTWCWCSAPSLPRLCCIRLTTAVR